MLVMQFKILPIAAGLGGVGAGGEGISGISFGGLGGGSGKVATAEELSSPFLWLLLVHKILLILNDLLIVI